jgi:hypothetical protein
MLNMLVVPDVTSERERESGRAERRGERQRGESRERERRVGEKKKWRRNLR